MKKKLKTIKKQKIILIPSYRTIKQEQIRARQDSDRKRIEHYES